jgi:hypothetical protein
MPKNLEKRAKIEKKRVAFCKTHAIMLNGLFSKKGVKP